MVWGFYPQKYQAHHFLSILFADTWEEDVGIILADLFKVSPEFAQHSSDYRVGKMPFGEITQW